MLAFPVPELPVGGTSLEPFMSALYFALAAIEAPPADSSIPAATVKIRAVRIVTSRIAVLLSKSSRQAQNRMDLGLFPCPTKLTNAKRCQRSCKDQAARQEGVMPNIKVNNLRMHYEQQGTG